MCTVDYSYCVVAKKSKRKEMEARIFDNIILTADDEALDECHLKH